MNHQAEKLSPLGRALLNRRDFMRNTGFTMGALGLTDLLSRDGLLAADSPEAFSGKVPIRPAVDPNNPYAPRPPHFKPAANRVLVIYLPGAISHVDTFDYKPHAGVPGDAVAAAREGSCRLPAGNQLHVPVRAC
ncbi:MAG: hypothetical protein ACYTGQ_03445, partial [Planctomycetota bacterium]